MDCEGSTYHYQWQIQDFERGGGNDIAKADLKILDSGGREALRALSTIATVIRVIGN